MNHAHRCSLAASLLAVLFLLPACGSEVLQPGGQGGQGGGGDGGSGGSGPSACPLSSGFDAHSDANAVGGKPCDGDTMCTFVAACDACEIACVEGTWHIESCSYAGEGC